MLKYTCFYHPDRPPFVDVGKNGKHFFICLECYKKQEREKWKKDCDNAEKTMETH